jgi:phosphoketolase
MRSRVSRPRFARAAAEAYVLRKLYKDWYFLARRARRVWQDGVEIVKDDSEARGERDVVFVLRASNRVIVRSGGGGLGYR